MSIPILGLRSLLNPKTFANPAAQTLFRELFLKFHDWWISNMMINFAHRAGYYAFNFRCCRIYFLSSFLSCFSLPLFFPLTLALSSLTSSFHSLSCETTLTLTLAFDPKAFFISFKFIPSWSLDYRKINNYPEMVEHKQGKNNVTSLCNQSASARELNHLLFPTFLGS